VVVPVQSIWLPFIKACDILSCTVIAAEPFSIALQRNQEPHIGIALKPDLSGRDAAVLTLPSRPGWFEWLPFDPSLLGLLILGWISTILLIAWLVVSLFG
jgi:hypothetical protein